MLCGEGFRFPMEVLAILTAVLLTIELNPVPLRQLKMIAAV